MYYMNTRRHRGTHPSDPFTYICRFVVGLYDRTFRHDLFVVSDIIKVTTAKS